MAGGIFSLANLFGMTIRESANDGSDFTNPDADYRRLFLGEDGLLYVKDSAGTVTHPYTGGGIATDPIWAAAGDLVQGTGNDAAAVLSAGASGKVLTAHGTAAALTWETPASALVLATGVVRFGTSDVTTTSTSFMDLTGASITITTGARRVLLVLTCVAYNSGANSEFFTFTVDGTEVSSRTNGLMNNATGQSGSGINTSTLHFLTDVLSAGSHTFKVQWKVGGGTGTFYCNASNIMNTFSAMEQGS